MHKKTSNTITKRALNRRQFIQSSAAASITAGAALKIAPVVFGQSTGKENEINLGIIGIGKQGQTLLNSCKKIPEIRIRAICDIWDYNRNAELRRLKRREEYKNQPPNGYIDYQDMLAKEKNLDAVIVATPDFWHAEHTVACLKTGLHVYCEKEMSNTLEGARRMVEAAHASGKLLQIGHQRRSNPIYQFCKQQLIQKANFLNRITTINGQWNRSKTAGKSLTCKPTLNLDNTTLNEYGFESMHQLLNWRTFKRLGGGPIADLGSHQLDIYNWFLDTHPKSIIASGGTDYWKDWQWYDNVMAIYEYETKQGTVRAFYQTLTTNSNQGYFEAFLGDEGTLVVSEKAQRTALYLEGHISRDVCSSKIQNMDLPASKIHRIQGIEFPVLPSNNRKNPEEGIAVYQVKPTPPPSTYTRKQILTHKFNVTLNKPLHQPHLENFFAAIRGKEKLNCPAEVGYETAVTVLKVNEAVAAGRTLEFKPEEFKI
jgi:predicted dehydrogenase